MPAGRVLDKQAVVARVDEDEEGRPTTGDSPKHDPCQHDGCRK
jgi:hypothetical protein